MSKIYALTDKNGYYVGWTKNKAMRDLILSDRKGYKSYKMNVDKDKLNPYDEFTLIGKDSPVTDHEIDGILEMDLTFHFENLHDKITKMHKLCSYFRKESDTIERAIMMLEIIVFIVNYAPLDAYFDDEDIYKTLEYYMSFIEDAEKRFVGIPYGLRLGEFAKELRGEIND